MILANALRESVPECEVEVFRDGWPSDPAAFDGADCVVMYADGGGSHPVNEHLEQLDAMADRGVGVVCIHYAVEVPQGPSGEHLLKWIGGYFETHWSVNPHWTARFEEFPEHPVTRGVEPFEINDEWYYHMRFRDEMQGVTPILSALPPESTLTRPDGPHSGNPHVRAAVLDRQEPQHVAWASERDGGSRGFGFTGGHVHWNWGDPNFRKLVLNAITWCAHAEVPLTGITDSPVTLRALEENQDFPQPDNFNRTEIRERLNLQSRMKKARRKRGAKTKGNITPVFQSKTVTARTPGHSVAIDIDITDAKELYLVVRDGGNGYSCDWADWAEPRLVGPQGEKKLTDLKWRSATAGWGQARLHKRADGNGDLRINGKPVKFGIGTHANSVIAYDLPAGFTRFQSRGGLDNGGTDQGTCGNQASIQFLVYTSKPEFVAGSDMGSRTPEDALDGLDIAEDFEVTLFGSEPNLLSPTNIDIDPLGRVWVCEVQNYRSRQGTRSEGDRIAILEDLDGDGIADKDSTFYQGTDIDSAHGICVLPTASGSGTKVIVSAGENVFVFTDTDGDGKADSKDVLFTGISGVQHDHGIHAFVFGPDGKLYFNFGNLGQQVRRADGTAIVDKAGNEVVTARKPYQEGMVFRCNLDGSDFETLGWNFRNNWEVCVDSFGTLWQSDNDDDGNRGVRINYVMEFGNYGYRDEFTGGGWKDERTGMHEEIPLRHWHLNDPGVVPNLLQTGAGSPTGICIYEGQLLPKVYRNQLIHCDAGPNIVRAYPVVDDAAGYQAEIVDLMHGARDKWFRPSDVCVAPDGSIFVADWYDPGVGGHRMGDVERGRVFRIAPPNTPYTVPEINVKTPAGALKALSNPCLSVRYMAWTALHDFGQEAEPLLRKRFEEAEDPRQKARVLWLLGKMDGQGQKSVDLALSHENPNIRILGVRLARQLGFDVIPIVERLVKDASPQVRREAAIALRHNETPQAAELWTQLAMQHDGKDRWYLEALGIAADKQWERFFASWQKSVGENWNTASGRDIIWRSRAPAACGFLAKIIQDENLPLAEQPRYFRAFDFHEGAEKESALESLLGL